MKEKRNANHLRENRIYPEKNRTRLFVACWTICNVGGLGERERKKMRAFGCSSGKSKRRFENKTSAIDLNDRLWHKHTAVEFVLLQVRLAGLKGLAGGWMKSNWNKYTKKRDRPFPLIPPCIVAVRADRRGTRSTFDYVLSINSFPFISTDELL